MLRALSLCACCRQYPGAAAGRNPRSSLPAVSAFPDTAVGSACTSTFSRLARRSLKLRPAHSRGHQVVTAIRRLQPFRFLHDCSDCFRLERIAGWALHPLESAALSRRTPIPAVRRQSGNLSGSNPIAARVGWRALYALGLMLVLVTLLIRAWVSESPRWLIRNGLLQDVGSTGLREGPRPGSETQRLLVMQP